MSARLEKLETLIAKGATDPFVHYARAMELRSLKRHDEALAAFGEIRVRFPTYVPSYLMCGQLASELGRIELAREVLNAGIEAARKAGDDHTLSELTTTLASLA